MNKICYILEDINENHKEGDKLKIGDYVVFKNIPFKEGKIIDIIGFNFLVQEIKIKLNKKNGTYSIKETLKKEWFHENELLL